jgi:hypothetical protein
MRLKNSVWLIAVCLLFTACSHKIPASGIRPEYPENRIGGMFDHNGEILFVEIDRLYPVFRWEPFPGPEDLKADKQGMLGRIRNVTYDLRIWSAVNDMPSKIIYSKTGLPQPSHKLETRLLSCEKYFWTARARFELNGEVRVTKWGESWIGTLKDDDRIAMSRSSVIPHPLLFRFQTPCP